MDPGIASIDTCKNLVSTDPSIYRVQNSSGSDEETNEAHEGHEVPGISATGIQLGCAGVSPSPCPVHLHDDKREKSV